MYTACYNVLWKKCSKRVDKFENKTKHEYGFVKFLEHLKNEISFINFILMQC